MILQFYNNFRTYGVFSIGISISKTKELQKHEVNVKQANVFK